LNEHDANPEILLKKVYECLQKESAVVERELIRRRGSGTSFGVLSLENSENETTMPQNPQPLFHHGKEILLKLRHLLDGIEMQIMSIRTWKTDLQELKHRIQNNDTTNTEATSDHDRLRELVCHLLCGSHYFKTSHLSQTNLVSGLIWSLRTKYH
jgi:hypothetical protein